MAETNTQTALVKNKDREIEFVPFGSKEALKLSLGIIRNYVAEPGKEGQLPDERQCMKFMMLCKARQLNPFEGDAFMIPFFSTQKNCYEWSLITAHSSFLKRAEYHPDYNGKKSGIIISPAFECRPCKGTGMYHDEACHVCGGKGTCDELEGDFLPEEINGKPVKVVGGWCKVLSKTKPNPEYQRLKLSTYAKNTKNWQSDPPGMICKCAEAAALRSAFPTTIGGLFLREEMEATRGDTDASLRKPLFKTDGPKPVEAGTVEMISDEPPPAKEPQRLVVTVANLCASDKIAIPILVDFLHQMNVIDPTVETLEQVDPKWLQMVIDQWADVSQKITEYVETSANPPRGEGEVQ